MLNVASGASVTLWSLSLENGRSNGGGAIYNQGTVLVEFSNISENESSGLGGAIYNRGTLTISHSSMSENHAPDGGAVYNAKISDSDPATVTFVASTFAWNRADKTGGVIYNGLGTFVARSSTFSHNAAQSSHWQTDTANRGGVLYDAGGTSEFSDCTITDNKSAPLTDTEREICGNHCGTRAEQRAANRERREKNGGIIYNRTAPTIIKLTRTVIAGSRGRNCGGLGGYTLDHSWSDDNTCSNVGTFGTDRGYPKLGILRDNGGYTATHLPASDSGLIDGGGATCASSDQRGAGRTEFMDPKCDIGAVETHSHPPSRLRPQSINTTPPTEHNEDLAALHERINTLRILAEATQTAVVARDATIATQDADITAKTETIRSLQGQLATCRVPCDYIPKRSYPLFRTRQILNDWLTQNLEEA